MNYARNGLNAAISKRVDIAVMGRILSARSGRSHPDRAGMPPLEIIRWNDGFNNMFRRMDGRLCVRIINRMYQRLLEKIN